nr:SAC3 family protein A-like isoform X1 [Physcomitrium patens]|eukprot:XP_024395611.1 SAC3 family protein A-like isoform X1 [Physcomitrella patens]
MQSVCVCVRTEGDPATGPPLPRPPALFFLAPWPWILITLSALRKRFRFRLVWLAELGLGFQLRARCVSGPLLAPQFCSSPHHFWCSLGVGDEYDNRRNFYPDPGNAWGGQHYDPAAQQQQYGYGYGYGYGYPSQQPEDRGQAVQEGMAAPPLPAMPPPQAPLPPSLATTPTWPGSDQGGANGAADTAYAGYNNYNHQSQQGQEYSSYVTGEVQQANNFAHPQTSNGSQSFAQGYAGYNYIPDQNAYNYQGYNNNAFQKQGVESYPQNAAMYSNAGAPYAPPNQYQHRDVASYSNTTNYYDPNGYQSTGYRGEDEQVQASWSDPKQVQYNYAGYAAANVNTNTVFGDINTQLEDSAQYAQDYSHQWAEYYASLQAAPQPVPQADTESNVAPQAVSSVPTTLVSAPSYASVVAAPAGQQPPPPGTAAPQPSWQAAAASYAASLSSQGSTTTEAHTVGTRWNANSNQISQTPWNAISSQTSPSDHFNQSQFPALAKHSRTVANQHQQQQSQASHTPLQHQSRSAKLHIVTNPRITANVGGLGSGKEMQKPAYVSVPAKQPSSSVSTDAVADATLQPGRFPSSLRAYVERALSRCKDESQKAACQEIMKDMITMASKDGTLFTRDWDTEPLFQIPPPSSSSVKKETPLQQNNSTKSEWSPPRRLKSRWEPPAAEDSDGKPGRTHGFHGIFREGGHDISKEKDSFQSHSKWEKREDSWSKSITDSEHLKNVSKRGLKRLRKGVLSSKGGENLSSDSDEEHGHGVHLGSLSTADTPEEKERRQSRFKRFDRGKDSGRGKGSGRGGKGHAAESASARRATALHLALRSGDGQNGRAVEDIDWDSLTIRGTCQEVEKRYLRLTSAPDPNTVRPENVLKRALEMVKSTTKSYLFKCDQLKSIRQDLTVQRIRDEFTVQVYETHARMALEAGDLPEYNQCQTQLKFLYGEGIKGCSNEFAAYSLLYILFNRGNSRDLLSAMAKLTDEGRRDEVVKHALEVRHAVAVGNYTTFFRLYRTAPVLSPCLMDSHTEKMRFEAVKCMSRSYRPTIPVSSVARSLGFTTESSSEGESEGLEECEEWLRAHGAHLQFDSTSNELVMEAKLSQTSLFMPEPEDVVPHGDANLALNDFFSRS